MRRHKVPPVTVRKPVPSFPWASSTSSAQSSGYDSPNIRQEQKKRDKVMCDPLLQAELSTRKVWARSY